jgi:hypothetical protein
MKTMILAMAAVAGLAGAGIALANERGGERDGAERFFRADANNDGRVTKDEVRAAREAAFARMDVDQDGFLTPADRADRPVRQGRGDPGARMAKMDSNADGRISKDEFVGLDYAIFDRLDANKDGAIDRTEAASMQGRRGGPKHMAPQNTPPKTGG